MNLYDISEMSYKNGYEKGYKEGRESILKTIEITYCTNVACPFNDCCKHPCKLEEEKDVSKYVRIADFSGVCRRYIGYLVDEIMGE